MREWAAEQRNAMGPGYYQDGTASGGVAGDAVVVTALDRLGRYLSAGIRTVEGVAELEREMISVRTREGLDERAVGATLWALPTGSPPTRSRPHAGWPGGRRTACAPCSTGRTRPRSRPPSEEGEQCGTTR